MAVGGVLVRDTTGLVTQTGPDTAGKVLTSNGAGALPTFQTPAAGGITQLTGDVTAGPGSGSQAATIANTAVTTGKIADGAVTEAKQTLADNTTNNVSTSKHGYTPKLPNDASKYLDGTGAYSVPPGTGTGTVSTTGTPANGNLTKFSGSASITNGDLSGDVTTSGALATTIAANAVTTSKINNGAVTEAKQTLADNTTNDVS